MVHFRVNRGSEPPRWVVVRSEGGSRERVVEGEAPTETGNEVLVAPKGALQADDILTSGALRLRVQAVINRPPHFIDAEIQAEPF